MTILPICYKFRSGKYALCLYECNTLTIKNLETLFTYKLKISEDQPLENLLEAKKMLLEVNKPEIVFYEVVLLDVLQIVITGENGREMKMTLLGDDMNTRHSCFTIMMLICIVLLFTLMLLLKLTYI